jgi:predicted transcriptional regulator
MAPNALAEHFDSSRQAVSRHIKMLSECDLLRQVQNGREIYYHFNPRKLNEVSDWLKPFQQMWEDRFSQLDKVLKNSKSKKNKSVW